MPTPIFCCPVCMQPLAPNGGSLKCENGHCFDRARQGYVNLSRSNAAHAKRHGDDGRMVRARQAFLDAGYYAALRDAVCALLTPRLPQRARVLDVGCGEGYYTAALLCALEESGLAAQLAGLDLSRDALILAARRAPRLELAVASAAAIPVQTGTLDAALSIFAPCPVQEIGRCLKPGGLLLRALPLREHLMGLKRAVYDTPYENEDPDPLLPGLHLLEQRAVRGTLRLDEPEMIENLFCMTPYYYKTSRADQQKLRALPALETELAFGLFLYQS